MRSTRLQPFLLALLLALSIGCGREQPEEDQASIEQDEQAAGSEVADGAIGEDPELQPEQRVVVVEPESGDGLGADAELEARERRLAQRQAELDARERRLRGGGTIESREPRVQPEPEKRAQPERQAERSTPPEPRKERSERAEPVQRRAEPKTEQKAERKAEERPQRRTEPVQSEEAREAEEIAEERESRVREDRWERAARENAEKERAERRSAPLAVTVPAGTVMEVEFLEELSSESSSVGETFRARVSSEVASGGHVAIPAGAEVVGVVTEAVPLRKVGGRAKLAVKFTDLVLPSGKTVPIDASFVNEGRSETRKDAATIGGGAAGGAVLGRILNRKDRSKGAVIGAVIGAAAGAVIASRTPGEEVVIPEGTSINLRLDDEVEVRPRR